jgi:hypothetical protein
MHVKYGTIYAPALDQAAPDAAATRKGMNGRTERNP